MSENQYIENITKDYVAYPSVIDEDLCQQILDRMEMYPAEEARLKGGAQVDPATYRTCHRHSLDPILETWLAGILQRIATVANEKWMLDVSHVDQMEILDYFRPNDQYKWHRDSAIIDPSQQNRCRKLSIIVQLSHPDEYEGCDLEISNEGVEVEGDTNILDEVKDELRIRGTVIVFPSFQKHRITPLISGRRKSLVAWMTGPLWR